MLIGKSSVTVYGLVACILHELGHLAAMLYFGQPIKKLVFYGAGIMIVRGRGEPLTPTGAELIILSAGCTVNLLLFALSGANEWGMINLVIGLFNLLPLKSLDGGKIFLLLLRSVFGTAAGESCERHIGAANAFLTICASAAFYIVGAGNFTVYLTLLYLLAASFTE